MARIKTNDIAYAIHAATTGKTGADLDLVLKNVVEFLSKNRLFNKSKDILNKLKDIEDQDRGHIDIIVRSRNKLEPGSLHEIKHWAVDYYKAKSVEISEEIDESLIGGMKIQIGSEVIDLSMQNQINQLQAFLLNS